MDQQPPSVGDRIRKLRDGKGLTLTELAAEARVSKAYLSQVEKGQVAKPSAQSLYQIASALGTSVGALLGEVSAPTMEGIDIPPELEEFATEAGLTREYKLMLATIRYRGKRPKTTDDWRFLWESIKRSATRGS